MGCDDRKSSNDLDAIFFGLTALIDPAGAQRIQVRDGVRRKSATMMLETLGSAIDEHLSILERLADAPYSFAVQEVETAAQGYVLQRLRFIEAYARLANKEPDFLCVDGSVVDRLAKTYRKRVDDYFAKHTAHRQK